MDRWLAGEIDARFSGWMGGNVLLLDLHVLDGVLG